MLLELRELRASYDKLDVLKGINLSINTGEIVAVIGPNGAGKSTALKAVFWLVKVTDVDIFFFENKITNLKPRQVLAMGISYIPQGRSVFPSLTVIENLEMGGYTLKSKKELDRKIEYGFELFPILKERQMQIAGSLSGGEQQMLALARALMLEPKLLLLDEPSLGLAPKAMDLIYNKITEINETGITMAVVEQNVSEVLELAHRAYVLDVGNIVMEDEASNLLNNSELKEKYLGN